MGLDKILLSQKKTIRFQDMGSSHRFPNAWEYFFPVLQKKKEKENWKYPYLSYSCILRDFSCVWLLNLDIFHHFSVIGVSTNLLFRNQAKQMIEYKS